MLTVIKKKGMKNTHIQTCMTWNEDKHLRSQQENHNSSGQLMKHLMKNCWLLRTDRSPVWIIYFVRRFCIPTII